MPSILMYGESGAGKTTAFRNMNPAETFFIDADKKGLSWKGWRQNYNKDCKNYVACDDPKAVLSFIVNINKKCPDIHYVVVDTLNGLMVAEEMKRMNEKGYDKWVDMASYIWSILDYSLTIRDDLTVIFTAHSQTERDDFGNVWTRMKTSGRKLDKLVPESKFTTVLNCKVDDDRHYFETQSNRSTAKSPMGMLPKEMDNDITLVIEEMKEY